MKFKEPNQSKINKELFIRLGNGESVTGVLRGEPVVYYTHWNGKFSEVCPGRQTCPLCAKGEKGKMQFRLNMVTKSGNEYQVRVLEQGARLYNALKDLNKEYPLERTAIKITRTGSGMNDTSYAVLPAKNGDISDAEDAVLSKLTLHDLDPTADDTVEDQAAS